MMIVDIHCHTFNADDLPVKGFVHRTKLDDVPLGSILAGIVDILIQGAATNYGIDMARVDALLRSTGGFERAAADELVPLQSSDEFEREVDQALTELRTSRPMTVSEIEQAMVAAESDHTGGREGFLDPVRATRRAIRWVKLFGRSRLDLVAELVRNFDDEVDLYTPLLVDLGTGLGDVAKTTVHQQMVLYEKISRLSMIGRLPGVRRARIHFFIGFDPLRELAARQVDDITTPLEIVKTAVLSYGFIGVKVYPQMGWRPSGNRPWGPIDSTEAAAIDGIVWELAEWCAEEGVPLTAHCSDSNYANDHFKDHQFGCPAQWQPIVAAFPKLHLNLGHFGGADKEKLAAGWPWEIAASMTGPGMVFADVGNHRVDDEDLMEDYVAMLKAMRAAPATEGVLDRLMYGSDWFMEALHPEADDFLESYRAAIRDAFGQEVAEKFMGANALHFLGFDDPDHPNNGRLRARYERYAPGQTPVWLTQSGEEG